MISICIATYNGEKFISEQLTSILSQIDQDDEIIISDNESNDRTIEKILSLKDSRIRVFNFPKQDNNKKYSSSHYLVTKNFENALRHANGDFIFLSDQDDVWDLQRIDVILPYLKQGCLVQNNYSIINEKGKIIKDSFNNVKPISNLFFINILKQPFHGCCMAFPRDILNIALPFPKDLIMHDNWIGLISQSLKVPIVYISDPLVKYRRHTINVSPQKSQNPIWFKIKYRIKLLNLILKRKRIIQTKSLLN